MPLSRAILSACLKAFAGLNALVAALLAVLLILSLFTEWHVERVLIVFLLFGFVAGAYVCRWAARRIDIQP